MPTLAMIATAARSSGCTFLQRRLRSRASSKEIHLTKQGTLFSNDSLLNLTTVVPAGALGFRV